MDDLETLAQKRRERLKEMRMQAEKLSSQPTTKAVVADAGNENEPVATTENDDLPARKRMKPTEAAFERLIEPSAADDGVASAVQTISDEADTKEADEEAENSSSSIKPTLFRSYQPTDDSLHMIQREQPLPPDVTIDHLREHLAAGKSDPLPQTSGGSAPTQPDELSIEQLAPRKIDWDLKRDIAKKLARLERRTARVIAELVHEREVARTEGVSEEGGEDDNEQANE